MAGIAAKHILDALLGGFVDTGDQHQVELDVLKGHLLMQNMVIRGAALQKALGLPLVVKAGLIGRVDLRIPWNRLDKEPTKLQIDNLLLLVVPQSENEWDYQAEEQREHDRKQAALSARTKEPAGKEEEADRTNPFIAKLTSQVLERLQVRQRACGRARARVPAALPETRARHVRPSLPYARAHGRAVAARRDEHSDPVRRPLSRPSALLDLPVSQVDPHARRGEPRAASRARDSRGPRVAAPLRPDGRRRAGVAEGAVRRGPLDLLRRGRA